MKRKTNQQSSRDKIKELLKQVEDYKPARGEFSYAERGRAVMEGHRLFNEAWKMAQRFPTDPNLSEATKTMRQLWFAALDTAYPSGFWIDIEKLRAGNSAGLESAVCFLEADPFFFRTGYEKAKIIRAIKPPMLTLRDVARLQNVVLSLVDRRDDRDFRAYCKLARKVDAPELREQLKQRLTHDDPDVRRRARWVLEALAQKDSMKKAKKA